MSEPTNITLLVPTIGRMDYLPMTRKCVSNQTRRDFRVIILDNASPPNAVTFFDDWAAEDRRVEILRADPRVPMFSNFNRGMRAVTQGLVAFVHDDDIYLPTFVEELAGALEAEPSAAFAGSNYDFVDEEGHILEQRRWLKRTEKWSPSRYIKELVGRGRNPVAMPGLMFRRSAFGPEGFDEALPVHWGDFVLLMRAAENGGMVAVEPTTVQIRRHPGQESNSMGLSRSMGLRTEQLLGCLDEFLMHHPDEGDLVKHLRRRVAVSHRAGLLWGWIKAGDDVERRACVDAFPDTSADAVFKYVLGWAGRHGVRPPPVTRKFDSLARAIAQMLQL